MTRDAEHIAPIMSWWAGGIGIGLILIVAVALVQPIGVSTQYVVAVGLAAIGVGLIGVHLLDAFGLANMKVKDLFLPGVAIAGMIFGVGFAVAGYCPGTALAAAAEGKIDACFTVAEGLWGAVIFAFLYPDLESSLLSIGQFGRITLYEALALPGVAIALPLGALCFWVAVRLPERGGAS